MRISFLVNHSSKSRSCVQRFDSFKTNELEPSVANSGLARLCSLRSKCFRGVQEQRKTRERYFARAKLGREQNKKEGVGEGKVGNACRQTPGF